MNKTLQIYVVYSESNYDQSVLIHPYVTSIRDTETYDNRNNDNSNKKTPSYN